MENIADALRMAAGVLLAILLVSLIVYIFNTSNSLEEEKSKQILIEQVNEFNKKFLAYEKTSMYGTDIMSVISLAINNNRDINGERAKHPDGVYHEDMEGSVNIIVKLQNVQKVRTKTINFTIDTTKLPNEPGYKTPGEVKTNPYFSNPTLSLKDLNTVKKLQDMITENNTIEFIQKKSGTNIHVTQKDMIGLEDFKSSIFKCADIKYTQAGRIYEMTFEDISN